MKRLDPRTDAKLDWLCVPLAIVAVLIFVDMLFDVGLNFLTWAQPALLVTAALFFGGYSIAAIKQKCWGLLAYAVVGFAIIAFGLLDRMADWLVAK